MLIRRLAQTVGFDDLRSCDLALKPCETKPIDIRKLRDAQEADFQGNKFPAAATDGSVLWIRLDNQPVMGRLVVLQRQKGMASNYDCQYCPCPPNYAALDVTPVSYAMLPGETEQYTSTSTTRTCNFYPFYYDDTGSSTWSSNNTPVATVNNSTAKGLVTGVSGGTANIQASMTRPTYRCTYINNRCFCTSSSVSKSDSGVCNVAVPANFHMTSAEDAGGGARSIVSGTQPRRSRPRLRRRFQPERRSRLSRSSFPSFPRPA